MLTLQEYRVQTLLPVKLHAVGTISDRSDTREAAEFEVIIALA